LKGASPHTPLCMVMSHDAPAFLPMLRRVPRINPLVTTPSEPLNHYLSNAVSSYLFHGAHWIDTYIGGEIHLSSYSLFSFHDERSYYCSNQHARGTPPRGYHEDWVTHRVHFHNLVSIRPNLRPSAIDGVWRYIHIQVEMMTQMKEWCPSTYIICQTRPLK